MMWKEEEEGELGGVVTLFLFFILLINNFNFHIGEYM
jgi:hypothetical protein